MRVHADPASDKRPVLEIRLAQSEPQEGWEEVKEEKSGNKIYLHKTAVITSDDVQRAVADIDANGQPVIAVHFNKAGQEKMEKATQENLGKRLAIVVDGKVVTAPTIQSTISKRAHITGRFTGDEVKAMVETINKSLEMKYALRSHVLLCNVPHNLIPTAT